MVLVFDPEDVAHRLGIDGEITGVEWDPSTGRVRVAVRPIVPAVGR